MRLGYYFGLINSKIILSLIYCFVLLPISIIMKCKGCDPFRIKRNNSNSYKEIVKQVMVDLRRIF